MLVTFHIFQNRVNFLTRLCDFEHDYVKLPLAGSKFTIGGSN